MSTTDIDPLPRCCSRHDDWRTLAEHLVSDFPELSDADVVREIGRAKGAVEDFYMAEQEALSVAELMARHQLMLLCGRAPDMARLDPERHVRQHEET